MMRYVVLAFLFLLLISCKNNTANLQTEDEESLKVVLPRGIILATDSIHFTGKLFVNKINWKITGTEPFWNISIKEDSVVYYTIENQDIGERFFITSALLNLENEKESSVYEYTLNNAREANIIITKETCSDGMSDKNYPYSAEFIYGDIHVKGCAEKK